ncbi:hypothetical protein CEXT_556201 [Caerostris extrusa]|uniref:Uncharacterized protein n=1 Tax=Caerostris extrusa TaxID=172846 RepID=A0AAV4WHT2_CAEEX|nr:hypothetical protein CEXT_556201 [Caerostris extrusa]
MNQCTPKRKCVPEDKKNVPEITEKEIRDALMQKVMAHCCYGKTPAKELVITEIKQSIAFRKTFTERRATCWIEEPFLQAVPLTSKRWANLPTLKTSLPHPPALFKSYVYHQEIPYTANIETCEECDGKESTSVRLAWDKDGNFVPIAAETSGTLGCRQL